MHGFTLIKRVFICSPLLISFLSSPSFAISPTKSAIMNEAKLGCMMCHRGESVPSDQAMKKNHNPYLKKKLESKKAVS